MIQVPLESIYKKIQQYEPKNIALVCLSLTEWVEKENGEKVIRYKLQDRAELFATWLSSNGIRHEMVQAKELEKRKEDFLSMDMCVVTGRPYYQLLSYGAKIRELGFDVKKPILLEIHEEEAMNGRDAKIAVKRARFYNAFDLLSNFVYVKEARPSPRVIEFEVAEMEGKSSSDESATKRKTGKQKRKEVYYEGQKLTVRQTRKERDPATRQACLDHYGYSCSVCEFDFKMSYGDAGFQLIHVHHLKPLADSDGVREVDPIQDLRPVCPNCHMIIHSKKPMYALDEVRGMRESAF